MQYPYKSMNQYSIMNYAHQKFKSLGMSINGALPAQMYYSPYSGSSMFASNSNQLLTKQQYSSALLLYIRLLF